MDRCSLASSIIYLSFLVLLLALHAYNDILLEVLASHSVPKCQCNNPSTAAVISNDRVASCYLNVVFLALLASVNLSTLE